MPCCAAQLRSVTTADDERPPGSKAFMHARVLAKSHAAIRVLLGVLRRVPAATQPATACRVLNTVRQVRAAPLVHAQQGYLAGLAGVDCVRCSGPRAGVM